MLCSEVNAIEAEHWEEPSVTKFIGFASLVLAAYGAFVLILGIYYVFHP